MTKRVPPYSAEVRARAGRMVLDHQGEHASQWAAIHSIAEKIGGSGETLRHWVRPAERDQGFRPGPTPEARERIKALARANRERRQANAILRKASAYFAPAALDRRFKPGSTSSPSPAPSTGSRRSAASCRSPRRRLMPPPPGAPIRARCRHGRSVMPP